jgi:hypothetical protein
VPKPAAHVDPDVSLAEQDSQLGRFQILRLPGSCETTLICTVALAMQPAAFCGDLDGVFSPGHPDELIDLVRDRVVHRQAVNV